MIPLFSKRTAVTTTIITQNNFKASPMQHVCIGDFCIHPHFPVRRLLIHRPR